MQIIISICGIKFWTSLGICQKKCKIYLFKKEYKKMIFQNTKNYKMSCNSQILKIIMICTVLLVVVTFSCYFLGFHMSMGMAFCIS